MSRAVFLGVVLGALGCGSGSPPVADPGVSVEEPGDAPRPDVLLVTIDTLRADRVGAYGDPLADTPALDSLARDGVLFREAHAVTPLTLPSHASILSGRYPVHHGLRDNGGFRLDPAVPLISERLQAGGYATAGFPSAYVLDGAWGLSRGFSVYRDPFHPEDVAQTGAFGELELPGAEVVNAAVAWWRRNEGQPRFAWVHLYDPHTPWREHPGWEGDPYRGEVHFVDGLIARLLREVDSDDLVIVTSDHGEGLWDHGEREHGVLLGRSITRVPLLVRPPGTVAPRTGVPGILPVDVTRRPAGSDPRLELAPVPDTPHARRVVDVPVSGVDVAPTIADYAGVAFEGSDGRSLRPALQGDGLSPRAVYAETWFPTFHFGWRSLHMVQTDSLRVERGANDRITDWPADPSGAAVRTAAAPAELDALLKALQGEGSPRPGSITGDQAAALEALGYLASAVELPPDAPDPRDQVDFVTKLQSAEAAPPERAIPMLESLVAGAPLVVDVQLSLALKRVEAGDLEGALRETKQLLLRSPDHTLALANAAFLSRALKRPAETLQYAERLQTLNPMDPRGYRLAAAVHVDQDDAVKVLEVAGAGVAVAPEDPNLNYLLGLAEVQAGDPLVGVEALRAAREHGSRAGDLDLWIGAGLQRGGKIEEARQAYDAASRAMLGDPRPFAMAGWMLYKADRCEDARGYLINAAKRAGAADERLREALAACGT